MKTNLKTVKASIIFSILLIGTMAALIPTTSAATRLINLDSVVEMTSDAEDREDDFLPFGNQRIVDVTITYSITNFFANVAEKWLSSEQSEIYLSIGPTPNWFTASIEPNVIRPRFTVRGEDPYTVQVEISVNENAPAKNRGEVTVIASVKEKILPIIFRIKPIDVEFKFSFIPGYLPTIGIAPDDTFKSITPGETATFDIGIENLGNGKTEVAFEVSGVPKGWSANIPTKATVGSAVQGDKNTISVPLTVQPPFSFGYHSERETIAVKITPSYFAFPDDANYTGKTYTSLFTIESRGFSTPGFETLFVILSLMAVIFIAKKRIKK